MRGSFYDLPPEIVDMVLSYFMPTLGVKDIWKLRLVSKYFSQKMEELAVRQPGLRPVFKSRLNFRRDYALLKKYIIQKLCARKNKSLWLPWKLLKVLENLEIPLNGYENLRGPRLEILVTALMEQKLLRVLDDFFWSSHSRESKLTVHDRNSVAALLGLDELQGTVVQWALKRWSDESRDNFYDLFSGDPLALAALGGQSILVSRILYAARLKDMRLKDHVNMIQIIRYAILGRQSSLIDILLNPLEDISLSRDQKQDLIEFAIEVGNTGTADLMYDFWKLRCLKVCRQGVFKKAVKYGNENIVRKCLEDGVEVLPASGYSPLSAATEAGYDNIVRLLIDKIGFHQCTWEASRQAAKMGFRKMLKVFLEHPNLVPLDLYGCLLFDAISNGHEHFIFDLLKAGLDLTATHHVQGVVALRMAISRRAEVVIEILLRNGVYSNDRASVLREILLAYDRKDIRTGAVIMQSFAAGDMSKTLFFHDFVDLLEP